MANNDKQPNKNTTPPVEDKVQALTTPTVAPVVAAATGTVVTAASDLVGSKPTVAEIIEVAAVKQELATPSFYSEGMLGLLAELKATGNQAGLDIVDEFKEYAVAMGRGKYIEPSDGARNHMKLFRTLQTFINNGNSDFPLVFATLLKFVDDQRNSCFAIEYMFRFTEMLTMNKVDNETFLNIITLMRVAAPVQGRKEAMTQIDFKRITTTSFNAEGNQRILSFFNK